MKISKRSQQRPGLPKCSVTAALTPNVTPDPCCTGSWAHAALAGGRDHRAEKDTVLPVSEGPPQCHPAGQRLHPGEASMPVLPPLPGPLPVAEVRLKHRDVAESLSRLCNTERDFAAALPCWAESRQHPSYQLTPPRADKEPPTTWFLNMGGTSGIPSSPLFCPRKEKRPGISGERMYEIKALRLLVSTDK